MNKLLLAVVSIAILSGCTNTGVAERHVSGTAGVSVFGVKPYIGAGAGLNGHVECIDDPTVVAVAPAPVFVPERKVYRQLEK